MLKITSKALAMVAFAMLALTSAHAAPSKNRLADTSKINNYPEKPTDISPLLIGETIPQIILPDAGGKSFDLNSKVAEKPTILIFYRGGWCPYCNKELAGIQSIQGELVKLGYQIIAISTDSPENLSKTMQTNKLEYTLLSDANLEVAKKVGIAFKAPKGYSEVLAEGSGGKDVEKLLPVPSVFILNEKGNIQFEYINPDYKQRISASLLQSVATALRKEPGKKS